MPGEPEEEEDRFARRLSSDRQMHWRLAGWDDGWRGGRGEPGIPREHVGAEHSCDRGSSWIARFSGLWRALDPLVEVDKSVSVCPAL